MATRKNLTVSDVLGELDENEYGESDSEDDFDGYVDMRDSEQGEPPLEEPVVEQMDVGANVDVSSESGSDNSDIPEYTLQPGCTIPVGDNNRPLHYLSHLVTDDMLEHIVVQTNLYAQQYIENHDLSPHSRVRQWSKSVFDVNELRKFLAVIILMGLVRYPQIESHWAVHWPFTNTHCSSVSINTTKKCIQ